MESTKLLIINNQAMNDLAICKLTEAFNKEFKMEFLNFIYMNHSLSMFRQYLTLFRNVQRMEFEFNKDLYDFTKKQVLNFLKDSRCKTYNAITSKYSLIKKYVKYATDIKKVTLNNINSSLFITHDELKECMNNTGLHNRYCTRRELIEGLEELINPSDKIIFLLIFEGVMGRQYIDLRELKVNDINLDEKFLTTGDGKRINFDDYTKLLLKATIEEDTYYKYGNSKREQSYRLEMASPYLIKLREGNMTSMTMSSIKCKINKLKDIMNKSLLTGKSIYVSGIAEKMIKIEKSTGKQLTTNEVKKYIEDWECTIEVGDMLRVLHLLRNRY